MSFRVNYSPTINKQSFIASETTGKFGTLNPSSTTGTKYAPSISEQSYIMNMIQNYGGGGSTGSSSIEGINIVNQEVLGFTGKVDNIPNISSTLKGSIKTSDILCELNGPLSNGSIYTFGKNLENRIICIGHDNTSPPYSDSISYSDDNGDSWTSTSATLFGFGKCIAWNGQIWVAGLNVAYSENQKFSLGWSLDGILWTPSPSENSTPIFSISCNAISSIKYQNINRFLAVGEGSDNTIATSYDGLYWSGDGTTIFSDSGNGVAWNGNMFVAVGSGTNTIAYIISNGGLWNGIGTSIFSDSGNGVGWNGEIWVAVGKGINTIAYSYNGTEWYGVDSTTNIFNGGAGLSVVWNGKIWVSGGGSGSVNTLAYSEDGKNWTTIIDTKFTGTSSYCRSITWYNGSGVPSKFIAVGSWQNTANPTQPFGIATSEDGRIWTPNYIAAFNGYGIVANSLRENTVTIQSNLNIAVGTGNFNIAYSEDDGITWTGITNSSPSLFNNAYSVVFNGKIWVVGGEGNNTLAYSRTGKDWTGISNDSINNPFKDGFCNGLAWNGKRFVGVGFGDTGIQYSIATSEDGICWTGVEDSASICQGFNGVAWNGRIFVAVGSVNSGLNNSIATSQDGKIWIPVLNSTTVFSAIGNGVAWNGELWVAVGAGTNTIAYSENGTVWIGADSTTNIFTQGFGVAWNGEVWIAVGTSSSTTIAYSRNGINWVGIPNSTTILTVGKDISWTGNRFVAVGDGTNSIVWSKDGINNWEPVSNSTNIFTIGYGIAWSGLKNSVYINQPIVMGGIGTNELVYSEDAINWIGVGTSIFEGGGCTSICWNGELWVAGGGQANNTIAYSYDGKSWTGLGNSIFSQTSSLNGICFSIYWNGSMFVAVGGGTSYSIVWSNDGKSWTGIENSIDNIFTRTVSWNGKIWIAGGVNTAQTQGKVATSIDGKVWTYFNITSTILNQIFSIAWNGLIWVAVGTGNNSIAYSENGTQWFGADSTTNFFNDGGASVAWNGNRFVAVGSGSSNKVAWSDDGTSWFGLGTNFFDFNYPNIVSWIGNQWIIGSVTKNYYYTSQNGINWNKMGIANWNQIPIDTNLLSGVIGIASNSLVGPTVVDSKIMINPLESLDVVSDSYYNTGYTNMSMSILSTTSS